MKTQETKTLNELLLSYRKGKPLVKIIPGRYPFQRHSGVLIGNENGANGFGHSRPAR